MQKRKEAHALLEYFNEDFVSKNTFFMSYCQKTRLHVLNANIVQRVKSCYKIKIDSRVLICCFYGVLLCNDLIQICFTRF